MTVGILVAWSKGSTGFIASSGSEALGYNFYILISYIFGPYGLYKILKGQNKTKNI